MTSCSSEGSRISIVSEENLSNVMLDYQWGKRKIVPRATSSLKYLFYTVNVNKSRAAVCYKLNLSHRDFLDTPCEPQSIEVPSRHFDGLTVYLQSDVDLKISDGLVDGKAIDESAVEQFPSSTLVLLIVDGLHAR